MIPAKIVQEAGSAVVPRHAMYLLGPLLQGLDGLVVARKLIGLSRRRVLERLAREVNVLLLVLLALRARRARRTHRAPLRRRLVVRAVQGDGAAAGRAIGHGSAPHDELGQALLLLGALGSGVGQLDGGLEALRLPVGRRRGHLTEGADAGARARRVARVALQVAEGARALPHRGARLYAPDAAQLALLLGAGARPARRLEAHELAARVLGRRSLQRAPPVEQPLALQALALRLAPSAEERGCGAVPLEQLVCLGRELAVEHAEGTPSNLLVHGAHGLLDAVAEAVAADEDVLRLAEPVDPPRRLDLLGRVGHRFHQVDARRGGERDADGRRGHSEDEDPPARRVRILELGDALVARRGRRLLVELEDAQCGRLAPRAQLAARARGRLDGLHQSALHLVILREDHRVKVRLLRLQRREVGDERLALGELPRPGVVLLGLVVPAPLLVVVKAALALQEAA
eukprot:scaffold7682_cov82-Phaeocystis_antarctica.AAC.1